VIGISAIAWLKVVGSVGVRALGSTDGGSAGWGTIWGTCVVGAGGALGTVVTWGWE